MLASGLSAPLQISGECQSKPPRSQPLSPATESHTVCRPHPGYLRAFICQPALLNAPVLEDYIMPMKVGSLEKDIVDSWMAPLRPYSLSKKFESLDPAYPPCL